MPHILEVCNRDGVTLIVNEATIMHWISPSNPSSHDDQCEPYLRAKGLVIQACCDTMYGALTSEPTPRIETRLHRYTHLEGAWKILPPLQTLYETLKTNERDLKKLQSRIRRQNVEIGRWKKATREARGGNDNGVAQSPPVDVTGNLEVGVGRRIGTTRDA